MNDAPDRIRIPLLRDRHTHPMLYSAFDEGINLNEESIDHRQGPDESRNEAVRRIREHAQRGLGGWTIAQGWNSGRYPLRKEEFDDLPPLVIFNLSLHGLIVNETGRSLLRQSEPEVAKNLDDQNWIERNLRRVLNIFVVNNASPVRLRRYFDWLLQEHGVYHAEEMLLVAAQEIRLFEESGLFERTRFWAAPEQYENLPRGLQEKVHGIKLFIDGALGAWTAAISRPYRDPCGTGLLIYEREELESLLRRYLDRGKPMALHAIGDRAIDQVIAAVEAVRPPHSSELRIEHAQLITEATARRAKALGIHLCMQPNFSDDSIHYAGRLPDGDAERNNPFRMLIDRVGYVPGDDLFFGSDGMPHGFREAFRQSLFPLYASQALTVDEFAAGYCMPDERAGHIEGQIDRENKSVAGRVVLSSS